MISINSPRFVAERIKEAFEQQRIYSFRMLNIINSVGLYKLAEEDKKKLLRISKYCSTNMPKGGGNVPLNKKGGEFYQKILNFLALLDRKYRGRGKEVFRVGGITIGFSCLADFGDFGETFNIVKQLAYDLEKTDWPEGWKKMSFVLVVEWDREMIAGYETETDDIEITVKNFKPLTKIGKYRYLCHEIAHRIYAENWDGKKDFNTRLRKIYNSFMKNKRLLNFDSNYWTDGPEELLAELMAHILRYPQDKKIELWNNMLKYLTGE